VSFPRYPAYKDSGVEWLGEVPKDWVIKPIKALASCNDEVLDESTSPDYEIDYVEISGVDSIEGIKELTTVSFSDAPSRARRKVRSGDIIVSTVRTYLRAIAPVVDPTANMIVSTGFAVVRPQAVASSFLGHLFRGEFLISEVIAKSVGVSYPAINASVLMGLKVPVPPPHEQTAIAAFLDRETAKIDALVADYRTLIELLQEKRQAVISHAVTKGLDPTVPMKDFGVEWLGEGPGHWRIKRNKALFSEFDNRSISGEGELLSVSHLTGVTPRSEKNVNMIMAETLEGYKECAPGDLVINTMWAWMGALGIAANEGLVSPSYNVYRLRDPEELVPEYYDYLCRTPAHVVLIKARSTGVWESRLRLYADAFFEIYTPVPPLNEQRAIVGVLDQTITELTGLITDAEEAITLLQERRTALISAAVTGKIDVRGLVAEAPPVAIPETNLAISHP